MVVVGQFVYNASMKRLFCTLLLLLSSTLLFANEKPTSNSWQPKKLIIFGDNYSDVGNQYSTYDIPVSPPYWHGRYSNGPVWSERLAEAYDFIPNPDEHPYYHRNGVFQDYAFGGATILWRDRPTHQTKTLDQQVAFFMKKHQQDNSNNSALAIFWIGTNDVLNEDCYQKPFRCVSAMTDDLTKNINKVYQAGVRHFFVISIPHISQTPRLKALTKDKTRSIINGVVKYFNRNLSLLTYQISQDKPGAKTMFMDSDTFYQRSLSLLNLQNRTVCYNNLGNYQKQMSLVCPDVDKGNYFYFDDFFPSTKVQTAFAGVVKKMVASPYWQAKDLSKGSSYNKPQA